MSFPAHLHRLVHLLALATIILMLTSPIEAAPQASASLSGTCRLIAPVVSALQTYSSRSSFCSSWLGLTTQTVTSTTTSVVSIQVATITSTTGTDTATAATITSAGHGESIVEHAVSETVYAHAVTVRAPTPTITAHVRLTTVTTITTELVCGAAKRAEPTSNTIPSELRSLNGRRTADFSGACSCLSMPISTSTVMTTSAVTMTTSTVVNVAAVATMTPTVQITLRTTSVPTITTIITPTSTVTPPPFTTTPVSTVTTTITTTVRVGAAQVLLANPTPLTPVINRIATTYLDDPPPFTLDLPFDVSIYGAVTRRLYVYLNGFISTSAGSNVYTNGPLPANSLPPASLVVYWNDLVISQGTEQGIYYEISGQAPHRQVSIEYFVSFYQNPTGYTHFIVNLFEDKPGRVVYTYFQTTSIRGTTNTFFGTIGIQNLAAQSWNQYSFDVVPAPGTSVEFNPDTRTWRNYGGGC